MKSRWTSQSGHGRRRGFTLVELMVVIVVIVLLVGLLVPAVSAVRRMAKSTATKAVLQAMDTGLTAFSADGKIGGGYPPSASDHAAADGAAFPDSYEVQNPFSSGTIRPMSGAGLLVWALVGADLLGTPGFKAASGYTSWADSTGSDAGGLYERDPNNEPKFARQGLYVDLSKMKLSTRDPNDATQFNIEAENKAAPNGYAPPRQYPMFLDGFGYPILYWKADAAGRRMVDSSPGDQPTMPRGIYHYADNQGLLVDSNGAQPLELVKTTKPHKLDFKNSATWTNPPDPGNNWPDPGTFENYIMNPDVRAKFQPHNADKYLLVSPGADGLYGTSDDVANFEHNGQ